MGGIKVLVVDDSAVVRQVLQGLLEAEPGIDFQGSAQDPLFALQRMEREWPDVIVLDIEMPRMDGLTFLRKIMADRPTPVVICSTLTEAGAETTMQAMAAGAVAVVTKPKLGLKDYLEGHRSQLMEAIRSAARANLRPLYSREEPRPRLSADAVLPRAAVPQVGGGERVVALGTSTGGTQALEKVLTALPRATPGMVIVQHMPEKFTAAFAARLDRLCEIEVKEAEDHDQVLPGRALIAPGGRHMTLVRGGDHYRVRVVDGPLVSRHRPSVDVLFRSVAQVAGRDALGVIMTGMGDDGAAGLLEMRQAGAATLAQDQASCVVWGMPREAVRRGAALREVALERIAEEILNQGKNRRPDSLTVGEGAVAPHA